MSPPYVVVVATNVMMADSQFPANGLMDKSSMDQEKEEGEDSNALYSLAHEHEIFIVDICVMVLTIVGNILVIYLICGSKRARTTHNITIVSVSVFNLITASFVMPTYFAVMSRKSLSDEIAPFVCKLNRYVWYWCKTVNIYSVIAMMSDRYFKVLNPCKRGYMSGRCMFFLNFVWFFGAAYNIWEIILNTSSHVYFDVNGRNVTIRRCFASIKFAHIKYGFLVADFIFIYILPLVVISYLAVCICLKVYVYPDPQRPVIGNQRFLMAIILTCMFVICQFPLEVMQAVLFLSSDLDEHMLGTLSILETVAFSQGVLHALAYGICSPEMALFLRKRRDRHRLNRDLGHERGGPQILLTSYSDNDVTEIVPVVETMT